MGFCQTQDVCALTPIAQRFGENKYFICLTSTLNNGILSRVTPSSRGMLLTLIAFLLMVRTESYLVSFDHMENLKTSLFSAFKLSFRIYFVYLAKSTGAILRVPFITFRFEF